MISVEAHLGGILSQIRPLDPVERGIGEAEGTVLAEDVTAEHPLPSFDNSAMDGYAVRSDDLAGASDDHPVTLPVLGEVAAGDTGAYTVSAGMCVRITTGARLPAGADAIVPVEWTDGGGAAKVTIRRAPEPGHAIRRQGEDLQPGAAVLGGGTRIGPMQLGLLAAAGRGRLRVRPQPRVVVFSTGNELAEPGTPIVPGRIWDSNSFMLAAAARQAGCVAYRHGPVADDPRALVAAIEDQLGRADALITSGGVSMGGEHDVVKDVLSRIGSVRFGKVAIHPGSPQGFGMIASAGGRLSDGSPAEAAPSGGGPAESSQPGEGAPIPIFTLPGNPVSAYVSFQIFVLPALNAMQGMAPQPAPLVRAALTGPLRSPPGKRSFLRGQLEHGQSGARVTPLSGQGSHQLAALASANALIVVPEEVTEMAGGDVANVLSLP
jgi:molybdopterin molybdotransferase